MALGEPDYQTFFRTCTLLRARLLMDEPLDQTDREAFAAMLDAFEDMMVGVRAMVDRIDTLEREYCESVERLRRNLEGLT